MSRNEQDQRRRPQPEVRDQNQDKALRDQAQAKTAIIGLNSSLKAKITVPGPHPWERQRRQ